MPVFHQVHSDARVIHVRYFGELTTAAVLQFWDRYECVLEQNPGFCEVVDLTAVDRVLISQDELRSLIELIHGIYLRNAAYHDVTFVVREQNVESNVQWLADYFADQTVGPLVRILACRLSAANALNLAVEERFLLVRH